MPEARIDAMQYVHEQEVGVVSKVDHLVKERGRSISALCDGPFVDRAGEQATMVEA